MCVKYGKMVLYYRNKCFHNIFLWVIIIFCIICIYHFNVCKAKLANSQFHNIATFLLLIYVYIIRACRPGYSTVIVGTQGPEFEPGLFHKTWHAFLMVVEWSYDILIILDPISTFSQRINKWFLFIITNSLRIITISTWRVAQW